MNKYISTMMLLLFVSGIGNAESLQFKDNRYLPNHPDHKSHTIVLVSFGLFGLAIFAKRRKNG